MEERVNTFKLTKSEFLSCSKQNDDLSIRAKIIQINIALICACRKTNDLIVKGLNKDLYSAFLQVNKD